jgi:hypothetical protein
MKTDVLIKVLVHLSIIAPIPKSGTEAVEEFFVPAMFPDSTPTEEGNTMSMVPSIFSHSSPKAVRVRTEPNQLLFAIKPFKFSIPSTLHAPLLCSLLKDKQWSIQNAGRNQSKTSIILTKRMKSKSENVTFTVTFFKECVSLCLGQEWNKSNVPHEMLEQCIHAMSSALHQSLTLVGYGDHNVFKYCFSCFEQSVSSANVQDDCSISHIFTPAYPDNVWFLKEGNQGLFSAASLLRAAKAGDIDAVKRNLRGHTGINSQDEDGRTALFYAAMEGHNDVVSLLVEAHADIDMPDKKGISPLYVACGYGHKLIADILLKNGANVNQATLIAPHSVPLEIAAEKGHEEIVERLLVAGAVINYQNKVDTNCRYEMKYSINFVTAFLH